MIVADSSAWIELLRDTRSPVDLALRRLLDDGAELAVTEVVVMELLAGARSVRHLGELRERLFSFPVLPLHGLAGYEAAAELYRACRSGGETIRKLADCLVAVPVIEAGASLLHLDGDFDTLSRHSALRVEAVPA